MNAKEFAKEYYQLEKSNIEIVSVESAITFAEKYHALQLQQTDVIKSVFRIMVGNSELERFKSKQKADEICEYYRGKGFPNAVVEELF